MFTPDEWKSKIEEFKRSGMSQQKWCQAQGIPYHLFKYRLYTPRKQKLSPIAPLFKELKSPTSSLKIKWNNLTLEIDSEFDEALLKRFLNALL